MPAPVKTKPTTPVREKPAPGLNPERYYSPERLCPSQRGDGEKFSR